MPELPEVEQFRRMLLPLVSDSTPLEIALVKENPPKVWLSEDDVGKISQKFRCKDVLRKGKQLCMVLERMKGKEVKYLYLHMGMTGSIRNPDRESGWGHGNTKVDSIEYPPKFTYLEFTSGAFQAAFSDPRKFGKAFLGDDLGPFDLLAPDALTCKDQSQIDGAIIPRLTEQSRGIKAILLDQNRVCSGVGNWVADEVLYQVGLHPDQQYLTEEQAKNVFDKLQDVVTVAVDCLVQGVKYPEDWLFNYRWTKKKAGKDHAGNSLTFLTSGGRTSAIVASQQKLRKSQGKSVSKAPREKKETDEGTPKKEKQPQSKRPRKRPAVAVTPDTKKGRKRVDTTTDHDAIDKSSVNVRRSARLRN